RRQVMPSVPGDWDEQSGSGVTFEAGLVPDRPRRRGALRYGLRIAAAQLTYRRRRHTRLFPSIHVATIALPEGAESSQSRPRASRRVLTALKKKGSLARQPRERLRVETTGNYVNERS